MVVGTLIQFGGAILAILANLPGHINPWLTFLAFLCISFGYNFVITAGNAMIIDASNAENRKIVFLLDYWAQNLSVILGAALGAWLFRPAFEALLAILLVTVLVSFFLTTFVMTETFSPVKHSEDGELLAKENIFQAYRTVVKDRTYMVFMTASIGTTFIIMQFDNFLPVHLANSFQTVTFWGFEIYGQRMLTIFLILACVLVVALMTTLNRFTQNWSHQKGFVLGSFGMALGMIFAFLTTSFVPIFVAGIIYTLGEIIYTPSVQTLGADLMHPDKIGAYNGVGAVRTPIASVLAGLLVSVLPLIHAAGVSLVLGVVEIFAIVLVHYAAVRHQREVIRGQHD